MTVLNGLRIYYTGGKIYLRWQYEDTAGVTYNIRRKIGLGGTEETVAEGLTATNYNETPSEDGVYIYWLVRCISGEETQVSTPVFISYFVNNLYSKELKSAILYKMLLDDDIVNVVEDNIFYQSQPEAIKYPLIIFSLNEYSVNSGIRRFKDITIPVTIYARDKADFDKLRLHVMQALGDFTYKGKEVSLHKLIEIGGKSEALDPQDNLTWSLEFTFKGKIEITNL